MLTEETLSKLDHEKLQRRAFIKSVGTEEEEEEERERGEGGGCSDVRRRQRIVALVQKVQAENNYDE